MATVKQGVEYEITASDKTAQATDSVMKRLDEMRAKEKAAAKERKAENEQHQAQLQKSKGLMQTLGAAASGSWTSLARALATAVAGTKALNAAMMKFAPYAAIVGAIVVAVKSLAGAFAAAKERVDAIRLDNVKSGMEATKKQTEAFNAALELTKAKYEAAADALDRQLEATKALTDAQDEYNKALDLSLAKTDKEREKIEEKYRIAKEVSQEEMDTAKRENARNRSDAKIAALEVELAQLEEDERDMGARWQEAMRNERALGKQNNATGVMGKIRLWWKGTDAAQADLEKQKEWAGIASSRAEDRMDILKKINDVKIRLDAERRNRKNLDLAESTATYAIAAKDVSEQEQKAGKDMGRDLDDYERWRTSGSTDKFDTWREKDRKAEAEKTKLRQKQYKEWLREMGRDEPETMGGEAFKRFSAMKDKEDAAAEAAEEQRAAEEAKTRETKKAEDERKRIRRQKIDATAAYQSAKDKETAAQQRLAAAKVAVSQAWGWYRDKDSMAAQLEEEKADAEARRQYEKDFEKLSFRRDWRTAKNLSVDQEAVRRVALAKEEEAAAQKAAVETAENTRRSAAALEVIRGEIIGDA